MVKFSDDTALLSLLHGSESDHENALTDFMSWCHNNFLDLNVSKTKELVIDFRHNRDAAEECIIHNKKWKYSSYIIQIFGCYFLSR